MDLAFFKKCLSQGMSKDEALEFTAAIDSHSSPRTAKRVPDSLFNRPGMGGAIGYAIREGVITKALKIDNAFLVKEGVCTSIAAADMALYNATKAGLLSRVAHGVYRLR